MAIYTTLQETEAVNLGQQDGEAANLEEDGEVANLEDDDEANETRSNAESKSITCHSHRIEVT